MPPRRGSLARPMRTAAEIALHTCHTDHADAPEWELWPMVVTTPDKGVMR